MNDVLHGADCRRLECRTPGLTLPMAIDTVWHFLTFQRLFSTATGSSRMRFFLSVSVALVSGCLVACSPKPSLEKVESPRPVRTQVLAPQEVGTVLTLPGEVRPRIESRLGFRVSGKLSQRMVSVGDRVVPGQVLARLDPTDALPGVAAQQAQLQAARTDRDLAALELERQRSLRAQQFISQAALDRQQAVLDASQSRVQAAEAQVNQARNSLDFQVLRADVPGVVTAIESEVGQVVAAGTPVIRVAQSGDREILVNVPEAQLAFAQATSEWRVIIPALRGEPLLGRLREVSPVSDPASRTYAARITLPRETPGLAMGMTAVVQAVHPEEPAFVLPLSALQSQDGVMRVWKVLEGNQVQPVEVSTAGFLEDAVRISRGLEAGDRVVVAGASLLRAGQTVKLLDEDRTGRTDPSKGTASPPGNITAGPSSTGTGSVR